MKQVVSNLKLELAQYRELQSFSQFSSDLDDATKATLSHGERVVEILRQKQYAPLHQIDQALVLLAVKQKYTRWFPLKQIQDFKESLIQYFQKNPQAKKLRNTLIKESAFNKKTLAAAEQCIVRVVQTEIAKHANYHYQDYGSEVEWNKLQAVIAAAK